MAIDKTQSFFIDEKYKREVEFKLPYSKMLTNTGDQLDENNITIIGNESHTAFKNENPYTGNGQITITTTVGVPVDDIHLIDKSTNTYYNEKTLSPQVKIFYLIPEVVEIDTSS